MIERQRYLTTSFDNDKAALGFTGDEFQAVLSEVKKEYRAIQLGNRSVTDSRRAFLYNIKKDLELIDENGSPYELWMEYHIMEELYHIVGRCDAGVRAVFQDAMREYEHLDDHPF